MNNKLGLINQFNIGNNGLQYYVDVYYKNNELYCGLMFSKKLI